MASEKKTDFPPVRACIFDMDGLLINTEDIYTLCADIVLKKHGRPPLPWSIKAQLMGVPVQCRAERTAADPLPDCKPLPGAAKLLRSLNAAHNTNGAKVHIALATSTNQVNYDLKTSSPDTKKLLGEFDDKRRILWDDPRLANARGKPAPDIFLLALKSINESLTEGEVPITPEECLVFEDSVPGVEAGRRAKMRVVWVPHEALAAEYKGKEELVLAGRIGSVKIGDESQLGDVGDGWGVKLSSLEEFPYKEFGIEVSP